MVCGLSDDLLVSGGLTISLDEPEAVSSSSDVIYGSLSELGRLVWLLRLLREL